MSHLSWNSAKKVRVSEPKLFEAIKHTSMRSLRQVITTLEFVRSTNEDEMQHHVFPLKIEPVVTEAKKILKSLADINPVTIKIPTIVAPKTLNDVIYEFSRAANNLIKTHEEQREFYKKKTADPANQVFNPVTTFETVTRKKWRTKLLTNLFWYQIK